MTPWLSGVGRDFVAWLKQEHGGFVEGLGLSLRERIYGLHYAASRAMAERVHPEGFPYYPKRGNSYDGTGYLADAGSILTDAVTELRRIAEEMDRRLPQHTMDLIRFSFGSHSFGSKPWEWDLNHYTSTVTGEVGFDWPFQGFLDAAIRDEMVVGFEKRPLRDKRGNLSGDVTPEIAREQIHVKVNTVAANLFQKYNSYTKEDQVFQLVARHNAIATRLESESVSAKEYKERLKEALGLLDSAFLGVRASWGGEKFLTFLSTFRKNFPYRGEGYPSDVRLPNYGRSREREELEQTGKALDQGDNITSIWAKQNGERVQTERRAKKIQDKVKDGARLIAPLLKPLLEKEASLSRTHMQRALPQGFSVLHKKRFNEFILLFPEEYGQKRVALSYARNADTAYRHIIKKVMELAE
jgi:hypothetical protein